MNRCFLFLLFLMMSAMPFQAVANDYPRGDCNLDGLVSIRDVTKLIDYLLSDDWGDTTTTPTDPNSNLDLRKLNILVIGNSYSLDAWSYVPFILKNYGIDVNISLFYYPYGSFINSASWGVGTNVVENYSTPRSGAAIFRLDTSRDPYWISAVPSNTCAQDAVRGAMMVNGALTYENTDWDIIAVQCSHQESAAPNTVSTAVGRVAPAYEVVPTLYNYIYEDAANKNFIFGWSIHHTLVYDEADQYGQLGGQNRWCNYGDVDYDRESLYNIKRACLYNGVGIVFPAGTAIMNARGYPELNKLGAGRTKALLADNVHLNDGFPCYIASLAVVESLFRKFYPQLSVITDATVINKATVRNYTIPGSVNVPNDSDIIEVTSEYAKIAKFLALQANEYPFTKFSRETRSITYDGTNPE